MSGACSQTLTELGVIRKINASAANAKNNVVRLRGREKNIESAPSAASSHCARPRLWLNRICVAPRSKISEGANTSRARTKELWKSK